MTNSSVEGSEGLLIPLRSRTESVFNGYPLYLLCLLLVSFLSSLVLSFLFPLVLDDSPHLAIVMASAFMYFWALAKSSGLLLGGRFITEKRKLNERRPPRKEVIVTLSSGSST